MIHQDSTSWQAIVEISGQWDKILGDVHRLEERSSQASSHDLTPPPNLNLMQYVPDIQSELEVCDNQMRERVETFARIFRENLERTSQEIQQAFEASWCQVRGEDISKNQTQEALIKLFQKQFAGEVQERKTIAIRALTRPHLAYQVQEEMENASGAEWTDETRALMERVYQQHPKLEAHEKKVLSEVSGLSLRQISIWFANQRQRRGWPIQLEESIVEEPEEVKDVQHSTPVNSSSSLSASTSSSTSSIERSPTPLTPFSASSACPSLSSSTSSRSSSDSFSCSPTRASFNRGATVDVIQNQPLTFDFSQPQAVPTPTFDIDQLIRQLTPPQPATNEEAAFTTLDPFNPTPPDEKNSNGPFAFKAEEGDAHMSSGDSTPPLSLSSQEQLQWLPINVQSLYPQTEITLSQNQAVEDDTPQAFQFSFAPLQLDTSQYLQQSPSRNVDLSSLVNDLDTDSFWKSFGSNNGIPQMPSSTPSGTQLPAETISIPQPEVNWSEVFLKDMETWGKPPQQAPLQFQF